MTRNKKTIMGLALALALMAVLSLFVGAVPLAPADVLTTLFGGETSDTLRFIVLESRLPQTLTAALCGAALAVGGLLLQNIFRNPLADPSVFGISSGAALGVAVVMLMGGGAVMTDSLVGMGATVVAAFIGAMAVTALVFVLSLAVRGGVALLIIGLMIGYVASAFILFCHGRWREIVPLVGHGKLCQRVVRTIVVDSRARGRGPFCGVASFKES